MNFDFLLEIVIKRINIFLQVSEKPASAIHWVNDIGNRCFENRIGIVERIVNPAQVRIAPARHSIADAIVVFAMLLVEFVTTAQLSEQRGTSSIGFGIKV